jgi:hypothetical protein
MDMQETFIPPAFPPDPYPGSPYAPGVAQAEAYMQMQAQEAAAQEQDQQWGPFLGADQEGDAENGTPGREAMEQLMSQRFRAGLNAGSVAGFLVGALAVYLVASGAFVRPEREESKE